MILGNINCSYSEGVWDLVYVVLIVSITVYLNGSYDLQYLWCPGEHTRRYANHMEVSTDDKKSDEYHINEDPLQYPEGRVVVISEREIEMKPMSISQQFAS